MKLFFDILITTLGIFSLVVSGIFGYHIFYSKNSWEAVNKKKSITIISLMLIGLVTLLYGSFIEPEWVVVRNQSIDLDKIKKPIKIALVADYQLGPYKQNEFVEKVNKKIIDAQPDLVLIAGDNVNNSANLYEDTKYLAAFKELADQFPVYAIHGNHEYGVSSNLSIYDKQFAHADISIQTKEAMEAVGVRYLTNDLEVIKIRNEKFYLFGGDSFWAHKFDPAVLKNRKEDLATIVLIHNPVTLYTVSGYDVDLMLAGHTHGGQLRLPFIGPLRSVDSHIPRSWNKGWVQYQNSKMYVTSGIGETGVRARLFNRPEIILLTIY